MLFNSTVFLVFVAVFFAVRPLLRGRNPRFAFIILASFFFRYKDSIEVEVGDVKVKTRGYLGPERLAALAEQIKSLLDSREKRERRRQENTDEDEDDA